jgi:phage shock protein PspC (stress-responsive transcriptional regulator)
MNKTVTINISGIIFHIEEDAYEKLSKYLSTIRGYFKDTDGRDEIMADIEARIAELLKDKTSAIKQVVLMADVDSVMGIMGKPEDFAGEQTEEKNNTDADDAKKESNNNGKRKRVFRDDEDSIIGGVCSGIAHYFDTDPLWIRLAWVALFLLFGAGVLVYIILWVVIPGAKTTAEKLEMRGEKVNINNIKRNFEEGAQNVKKKMEQMGDDAKQYAQSFKAGEKHSGIDKMADFITSVFGSAFKIVGKIFAFFLIVICVILMIGLTGTVFGFSTVNNIPASHFSDYIFTSSNHADLAIIGLFLFAGIPLLMLIYAAVKALLGIKSKNRIVNLTSTSLWAVGLALLIYVGYIVSDEFRERAKSKQTVYLSQPASNTIYIKVKRDYDYADFDIEKRHRNYRNWTKEGYDVLDSNGTTVLVGYPEFNIRESANDSFYVVINKYARGADRKLALDNAKQISYTVSQTDSLIELQPFFEIKENQKIRAQHVDVILHVPKGKMIYMNKSVRPIIYDIENVHDVYDGDMLNRRWIMTESGLNCIDCDDLDLRDEVKPGQLPPPPAPPLPPVQVSK